MPVIKKSIISLTAIVTVVLFIAFGVFSVLTARIHFAQQAQGAKEDMRAMSQTVAESLSVQATNVTEGFEEEVDSFTKMLNLQADNLITWQHTRKAAEEASLRNTTIAMGNTLAKLLAADALGIIAQERFFLLQEKADEVVNSLPEVIGVTFYDKRGTALTTEIEEPQGKEGQDFVFVEAKITLRKLEKGSVKILLGFTSVNQTMLAVEEQITQEIQRIQIENTQNIAELREKANAVVDSFRKEDSAILSKIQAGQENFAVRTAEQQQKLLRNESIGIVIAVFVCIVLILIMMTRSIARPLNRVAQVVKMVSVGDLKYGTTNIKVDARREDEIGILARALQDMQIRIHDVVQELTELIDAVREGRLEARGDAGKFPGDWRELITGVNTLIDAFIAPIDATAQYLDEIAQGTLPHEIPEHYKGDFNRMMTNLHIMVDNLRVVLQDMSNLTGVLTTSTNDISASVSQLASSASETSASIGETSTTLEEVRNTSQLANQKAQQVSASAQKSTEIAQIGREATEDTVVGMNHIREQMTSIADSIIKLSEQSQAIGGIIATVGDLADQSNLLAVNASIEAAKAGEQGKGFTVVAHEIRSLAEQSKQATMQVQTILNNIQKATGTAVLATEQGTKAVEAGTKQATDAGESIKSLTNSIIEAAQAMNQIAISSQEQTVGMNQIAEAMESIKLASIQNVDSSHQLEGATHNLQELGQKLKLLVERYTV